MNDNKQKSNEFGGVLLGIIIFLIGYGWFSFFEKVSGDTRWLVDLVGWALYIFGVWAIITSTKNLLKDNFSKK
jgi:hypothetical protein